MRTNRPYVTDLAPFWPYSSSSVCTNLILFLHLSSLITDISSSYVSRLDPEHEHHHGHTHDLEASLPSHSAHSHDTCRRSASSEPQECTPLITPQPTTAQRSRTLSAHNAPQIFDGHHHFESRASHCTDGPVSPRVLSKLFYNVLNKPDGVQEHSHRTEPEASPYDSAEDDSTTVAGCSQDHNPGSPASPASSRRQIVGILVNILITKGSLLVR